MSDYEIYALEQEAFVRLLQAKVLHLQRLPEKLLAEAVAKDARIAGLEADIKLLEAGVVTVDGEREVLYGRIDELLQAMKGGE